jgi:hypothetical protein
MAVARDQGISRRPPLSLRGSQAFRRKDCSRSRDSRRAADVTPDGIDPPGGAGASSFARRGRRSSTSVPLPGGIGSRSDDPGSAAD